MKINSILGDKATGSIGNVTISGWKNLTVGRQKPTVVANPNTIGQQNQRSKFSFLAAMYSQMATLVTIGFVTFRAQITEYNAFMKENIRTFFTNAAGSPLAFDFDEFLISKGSLAPAESTVVYTNGAATIDYYFDPLPNSNQSLTDIAYAVVLSSTGAILGVNAEGSMDRNQGQLIVSDAAITTTGTKHTYLFFATADYSKVSTSRKSVG